MPTSSDPAVDQAEPRHPTALHGLLCFCGVVLTIAVGLFGFGISLHSLMFICLLWVASHARWLGHDLLQIRMLMSKAITRALPAIYIFLLIGMVIASFMHSGTIATLMYFGLDWLSPPLFLPAGLVMCAMMSVATGTAWGTVGTLGVVFIGIGEALGIPLPVVAAMVVGGATFGDKMSPVSDTTNLAAMSAGTNLYRHIYAMTFTTAPSFLIALLLFAALGLSLASGSLPAEDIDQIRQALRDNYGLFPLITLLPIATLALLSLRRLSAEATMAISVVVAVLVAIIYQGVSPVTVLNALWENVPGETGLASLDDLLGRGGMYSMSWTLLLALLALALGGLLHGAGFLTALLAGFIARVKRVTSLIAATIAAGLVGNLAMGEAYISIILNCQLFREKFASEGLDPAILSRSVEEGSTLTTGLIPWTTAGAFYAATLGVPVLDYLPYAFFNYGNALVSLLMAALGLGLLRGSKK